MRIVCVGGVTGLDDARAILLAGRAERCLLDAGASRCASATVAPLAGRAAAGLLTSPEAIAAHRAGSEQACCDELALFPAVAGLDQVDRLADVCVRG